MGKPVNTSQSASEARPAITSSKRAMRLRRSRRYTGGPRRMNTQSATRITAKVSSRVITKPMADSTIQGRGASRSQQEPQDHRNQQQRQKSGDHHTAGHRAGIPVVLEGKQIVEHSRGHSRLEDEDIGGKP